MNKSGSKISLKVVALLVMIVSSLAFFFGFAFSKNVAFAYDETNYYTLNFSVSAYGSASIEYVGEGAYPEIEQIIFKADDGNYKIHKTVADDPVNACLLKVVYETNDHYVLDNILVDGTPLASDEQTFTYSSTVSAVSVSFKAQEFSVEIKTQFSTDGEIFNSDNTLLENHLGTELNFKVPAFATMFDETFNVIANDRDSDHLEFDGYYILGESEENISDGRKIKSLTLNEDFISKFVKDGKITIYARYNFKKQLNINVDSLSDSFGDFEVILIDKNSNVLNFVNGNYYSVGTKYTIIPSALPGYEFSHYYIDGSRLYTEYYSNRIGYQNVDINLFFTSKNYELNFYIVNSQFSEIDYQPLSINITYNSSDPYTSPVSKYVKIGDRIDELSFISFPNYENYKFVSWQTKDVDGNAVSLSDALDNKMIKGLVISQDFIDSYAKDGKISIYAVFVMQCHLSIQIDDVGKDYELYYGGSSILPEDLSEMTFDFGSIIILSAPSVENMTFDKFSGLLDIDEYTGGTSVFIKMNGDRSVSISYHFNETEIKLDELSKVSNGKVVLNKDKISIGDTLIISLNLKSGYKLTDFLINDKTADKFVLNVNRICGSEKPVATYSDNGIVTIYVNQTVFDYFKDNNIKVVAHSKINSTYAILLAVYLVITLSAGGLLVWFFVLAGKNKLKVIELKEKQQKIIEKKQKEVEELYSSDKNEKTVVKNKKDDVLVKKTPLKTEIQKTNKIQETSVKKVKQTSAKSKDNTKPKIKKSNSETKTNKGGK